MIHFLLPSHIFGNFLFIKTHCADAISLRPEMAAPTPPFKTRMQIKELDGAFTFYESDELGHRVLLGN